AAMALSKAAWAICQRRRELSRAQPWGRRTGACRSRNRDMGHFHLQLVRIAVSGTVGLFRWKWVQGVPAHGGYHAATLAASACPAAGALLLAGIEAGPAQRTA